MPAFSYKPRFVDIRVRPPKPGEAANEPAPEEDVYTLKPGERACDHAGCRRPATARAPKHRDLPDDFYWFCQPHAAEYNKQWDFFAGMSEGAIRDFQRGAQTGHRPTWSFKADARNREAAAKAWRAGKGGDPEEFHDPFDLFGRKQARAEAAKQAEAARRGLGKLERQAFDELGVDQTAAPEAVRARYHELVKRFHPDANGGDRSTEDKLQRVIRAYQTLKKRRLA